MAKKTTKKTTKKTKKKTAATRKPAKKAAPKKKVAKKTTKKVAKKTAKKAAPKKKVAKKTTKKVAKKATAAKAGKKSKAKPAPATTGGKRRRQTVQEAALASEADAQGYVVINGRRIRKISTNPEKMPKKKRSTTAAASSENTSAKIASMKTKLSKVELKEFQKLLVSKRRDLFKAVDSLETEALRSDDGDTSTMPIHMADVGSDVYEQDLMLGMAASERERIREIDEAMERIVNKTYGICMLTGKQIRNERLRAKPWAKYSIDAKRQVERGMVQ